MAAPHVKNAPKGILLVLDETTNDYVPLIVDSLGNLNVLLSPNSKVKVIDSAGIVQDWVQPEGQEASANSMPMVLSTEQEAILSALATETTLDGIDTQITEIKAIIGPVATLLEVDSGDSTIKYIGKGQPGSATSGAGWQIQRMTKSATGLVIEFADGNSDMDKVWDDRESLSYS